MRSTIILAAVLFLTAVGCTSRGQFTRPNYDTIHYGQQAQGVVDAIGAPREQTANSWTYHHIEPFYEARIEFENGQVVRKLWWDNPGDPATQPTQPAGKSKIKSKSKPKTKHKKTKTESKTPEA